jgi:hypothetical protein
MTIETALQAGWIIRFDDRRVEVAPGQYARQQKYLAKHPATGNTAEAATLPELLGIRAGLDTPPPVEG